eukprot:115200-Chlamydomonas_euryale.AAC.1
MRARKEGKQEGKSGRGGMKNRHAENDSTLRHVPCCIGALHLTVRQLSAFSGLSCSVAAFDHAVAVGH